MNANLVFTWLHDARYAPEAGSAAEARAPDGPSFLPAEIVDRPRSEEHLAAATADPRTNSGTIEIDVAGGPRLRIVGAYDPDALARLIRGLST